MGRSFANLRILPSVFGIPQFCESCLEGTASGAGVWGWRWGDAARGGGGGEGGRREGLARLSYYR